MPKFLLAAGAVALLMTMTGCHGPDPHVTLGPSPSATPVFASDEEALAAAEEAYGAYTEVEDAIAQEGGAGTERLVPLVTPEWLEHEVAAFESFQATGRRQVGSTTVSDGVLQRVSDLGDRTAEIAIYVCVDFSGTSFVDAVGAPVESSGPREYTLEAVFEGDDKHLLLSGSEPWADSIC